MEESIKVTDAYLLTAFCKTALKEYRKYGLVHISPYKTSNGEIAISLRKKSEKSHSIIRIPDGFTTTDIVEACQKAVEYYLNNLDSNENQSV